MAQRSAHYKRLVEAHTKVTALLSEHGRRLPMHAVRRLRHAAAELDSALKKGDMPEPQLQLLAFLTEAEEALWEEVIELNQRLARVEAMLQRLRDDSDRLYLRSMAHQLENKLYRLCLRREPGEAILLPHRVENVSLKRIKSDAKINTSTYDTVKNKFRNLESTVGQLRDVGNSSAHPWLLHDSTTGEDRPVTKEDLQVGVEVCTARSVGPLRKQSALLATWCSHRLAQRNMHAGILLGLYSLWARALPSTDPAQMHTTAQLMRGGQLVHPSSNPHYGNGSHRP